MKINSNFKILLFSFFTLVFLVSCKKEKEKKDTYVDVLQVDWKPAQEYYLEHITIAISYLDTLKQEGLTGSKTKEFFDKARAAFKKAESFGSYLNPPIGHRANGPALPFYKEDNGKILKPVGFQKIEESIYGGEVTKEEFETELYITKGLLVNLKGNIEDRPLNPKRFFVATHQQLMRIVSLGTSGFDTPTTGKSIAENAISLQSLKKVYQLSVQDLILKKNNNLDNAFILSIDKAVNFINKNTDFESFDRFTFLRDYMNPITRNWVEIRKTSDLWTPNKKFSPFNFDAPTFFEENSFNVNHFIGTKIMNPSQDLIALGEKLFFEKRLSKSETLSCASCHNPKLAYADGVQFSDDNLGRRVKRNAPTLLNAIFQKSFFWDGRAPSLEAQIGSVFKNKSEFDTHVHKFSNKILEDSSYVRQFEKIFGKIPTKNRETVRAITAYVSTLTSLNSKFDKNIRGEEDTFTVTEKNGFNLYMGKALCATCHFIPLTNGTVPPFFSETEKEVIGVPEKADNKKLDGDAGFYWRYKEDLHKGMFKTPTVRNAALTGPYMHNGVYNTLEEVMNFYNLGGGGGLGFEGMEHQTLPFDNLNLTKKEIDELVAFIKTLSDNNISQAY